MGHINESDLANKFQLKINSNLYKTYLIKDLLFKLITVVFNLSFPFLCSFSDIFLFFSLKQTKKIMPPAYDLTSTLKYWQDIQQCRVLLDWFKISTDCVPVSSNHSFIWKLVKQNWWKFRGLWLHSMLLFFSMTDQKLTQSQCQLMQLCLQWLSSHFVPLTFKAIFSWSLLVIIYDCTSVNFFRKIYFPN